MRAGEKTDAQLQVGAAGRVTVWVNPRTQPKPAVAELFAPAAVPGRNSARVTLDAGWNEVLVRVEGRAAGAGLFVEFRAADNAGPLPGLEFRTDPPDPNPKKE